MAGTKQTTWRGKIYPSLTAAWKAVLAVHDLSEGTLRQRYDRLGKPTDIDQVVDLVLHNKKHGATSRGPRRPRHFYRGERFKTQKAACKAAADEHGISIGTIEAKLYVMDDDSGCIDYAIEVMLNSRPQQAVYKGKQRKSLNEAFRIACKDHPDKVKESRLRYHLRCNKKMTVDDIVIRILDDKTRERYSANPIVTRKGKRYRICNRPDCDHKGKLQPISKYSTRNDRGYLPTCKKCVKRLSNNRYADKVFGYQSYENKKAEIKERKRLRIKGCNICKQLLSFTMFSKARDGDGRQSSCRICTRAGKAYRDWKKGDFDKGFAIKGERFTRIDYERIIKEQNLACAICKSDDPKTPKPREDESAKDTQTFNIDHCHDTGEVRGLLCTPCNFGIAGMYGVDSKMKLINVAKYLDIALTPTTSSS